MSHNIDRAAFSTAEGAGWTGLGREIPSEAKGDPAKIAALIGLDTWKVESLPVYTKLSDGTYVEALDYAAQSRTDTHSVLGITSRDRYHLDNRQPVDIIEAMRDTLHKHGADMSHVASLRGGGIIVACALLPPEYNVGTVRDAVRQYLTLSSGYTGGYATDAGRSTVRAVCNNTLDMGLSESERKGTRRSISASTRITSSAVLPRLLEEARTASEKTREEIKRFIEAPMSKENVRAYFAKVLEIDLEKLGTSDASGKPYVSSKMRNMLDALLVNYERAPGAELAHGNTWAALNAVTFYATHQKTVRDTYGDGENIARLASNFNGDAARIKARALELARVYVTV